MLGPEWGADYAGGDGCDADVEAGVQGGEGADEAVEGVFCGVVEGLGEGSYLAGYGGDVED